jgi:hypothetical protein
MMILLYRVPERITMTSVRIDPALLARLNGLNEKTEFRDENGRVLGHFIPAVKGRVSLLPSDRCPYNIDELLRMRNECGGKSLAEIWRGLGEP